MRPPRPPPGPAPRRFVPAGRVRAALAPGPSTPLWNELVHECAAHLVRHGDKARLARILGLPRQRVHQLLVERTACADAERTLQLLLWLAQVRRGGEIL